MAKSQKGKGGFSLTKMDMPSERGTKSPKTLPGAKPSKATGPKPIRITADQ